MLQTGLIQTCQTGLKFKLNIIEYSNNIQIKFNYKYLPRFEILLYALFY